MLRLQTIVSIILSWCSLALACGGAEFFTTLEGKPDGDGSRQRPWDLATALAQPATVKPGDTIWIGPGTYKHPDRKLGSPGFRVRLAGAENQPVHLRAAAGQRVTLDGGLTVEPPANYLWIWDLEILVSENFSLSRELTEPGSHPTSYNRPWGGLNVNAGKGCKYIHLLIHDNAQGISFWSGATDSEVYGAIIYDNGWKAPDRGHGHAIYTQNQNGVKTISDCIMTGGFSYTVHAYGSSRAYVDNYLITGNICYDAGPFLVGGGRPSQNIRVLGNSLYGVGMQLGYSAPSNADCEVRDNLIVNGGLSINKFQSVAQEGNLVLGQGDPRPDGPVRVEVRPSNYDSRRAHVAVFNWSKQAKVELLVDTFLRPGERYRLLNPRELFGAPVAQGVYQGQPISVPVVGEFAAWVLLKVGG